MKTEILIEKLQSIEFICLDNDLEEETRWTELGPEHQLSFLELHSGKKGYISLRFKQQRDITEKSGKYADFHLAAHYLLLDYIICFAALGKEINLEGLIEETLKCASSKNSEVIEALLDLQKITDNEKVA